MQYRLWNPIHNVFSPQKRSFTGSQSHRRSESFSERHFPDSVPSGRAEREEHYLQSHPRSDTYSRVYHNRDRELGHPSNRQNEYLRKNAHTTRPFNTGPSVGYPRERSRSPSGY